MESYINQCVWIHSCQPSESKQWKIDVAAISNKLAQGPLMSLMWPLSSHPNVAVKSFWAREKIQVQYLI
jgi:hypothetical protein